MSSQTPPLDRRRFLQATAAVAGVAPLLDAASRADAATAQAAAPAAGRAVAAAPGPDLGSLYPFIQRQAGSGVRPLSYLAPRFQSVRDWRHEAYSKVLDLLHYSPAPCDPAAEVVERVDAGDHIRERVLFNTTPDLRVPAIVLVPKGLNGPAPAIVALHDHGGFYLWGKEKLVEMPGEHPVFTDFRARYYGGRSIGTEMVRRGYVVVVIDMFYWGERRLLLDDDPADWRERPASMPVARINEFNARASQQEQLMGRTIYSAGFTWPGVMFWDDIRTVDYLRTRADVDPERIGCVGLSVGAVRAAHLAALDERIKAGVVVCWMTSFAAQLRNKVRSTIGHTKVVPGLYRHLDYPDVATIAMPRPLLVFNGTRDGLFDLDGVRASHAHLHACYEKAGVPEHCVTRLLDTPHEFNVEMQDEAWAWLKRFV